VSALVGALVAGILDHYFFNLQFPHTVTLFWFYMGLAIVVVQNFGGTAADGMRHAVGAVG